MARVTCDKLTKEFDSMENTIRAVDSVDIDVKDGTFVTILGPSGCGKTTLLRMIAGLESPTEGSIHFGEENVTEMSAQDRHIGMVFQNIALFPFKTVRKNIEYGLKYTDTPAEEREEKTEEMAGMLGIDDLLDKKPNQLSGGQRQRVALGRALVRNPNVFLLDEPMSDLDAELKVSLRTELKELHKEFQTTTFYVTHDQEEAMTLSEEVIIIRDGQIEQHSPPFELFTRPKNTFVAQFIGSPNINFFTGTVTDGQIEVNGFHKSLELSPDTEATIENAIDGSDLTLGIRPTALELVDDSDHSHFTVETELYEQLGSETILHARSELNDKVRVIVPPLTTPEPGEKFHVRLDRDNIHLFKAETGRAIQHGLSQIGQKPNVD